MSIINKPITWLKSFFHLLDPSTKRQIIYMIGLSIVLFSVELLFAYAVQSFLFSAKILTSSNNILTTLFGNDLYICTLLLIGASGIRFVLVYFKAVFSMTIGQSFILSYRARMLSKFQLVPKNYSSYQILSYFTDYTSQGSTYVAVAAAFICNLCFLLITLIGVFIIAPLQSAVCISASIFLLLIVRKSTNMENISENLNRQIDAINKTIILALKNYQLLKIYGAFESELKLGIAALDGYYLHFKRYANATSLASATPWFVGMIATAGTTVVSRKFFPDTSANLITFFYLLVRLAQNFGETNQAWSTLKAYKIPYQLLQRLDTFLEKASEESATHAVSKLTSLNNIALSNLSYALPNGKFLFKSIDLNLKKGDILVIKGPSGSGKSTLLSLICGLNQPTSGEIIFDTTVMPNLFSSALTDVIGYVDSDPFMIEGSFRENLLFANYRTNVSDDEILMSLSHVALAEHIASLTNGLDTLLSEKTELSTGQKQRISLARALLRNPHLLILDEATANLDTANEVGIVKAIESFRKKMITIVISHKNNFDSIATIKLDSTTFKT